MPYDLIIDLVVAVLLAVTIVYAIVLNSRLRAMRRDRSKLEKIANDFAKSTEKANDSIVTLKTANESLQRQLDSANALRDDLAYLLDRGEKTADRLEDLVRVARDEVGISPAPSARTEDEIDTGDADELGENSIANSLGQIRAGVERAGFGRGHSTFQGGASRAPSGSIDGREPSQEEDAEEALLRAIRSAG